MARQSAKPIPIAIDRLPVMSLFGVGAERSALLAKLGIRTVLDLLLLRPRRYEDRRRILQIKDLKPGVPTVVRGKIITKGTKQFPRSRKTLFELHLSDESGRLVCRWWNMPFMERYFECGQELFVFGKPEGTRPPIMDHPETEPVENSEEEFIHVNRIVPIYPLTEGLSQRWLRALIWRALNLYLTKIPELWPKIVEERAIKNLPPDLANTLVATGILVPSTHRLVTRCDSVRMLHNPNSEQEIEIARARLALDEFYQFQLALQQKRLRFLTLARAHPCGGDNRFIKPFLNSLPFQLTEAQKRVLREIRQDMAGAHPMRRLLQGDVGSGKTVVAACAALMALESGYNVALMAPTEILAQQHFQTFSKWFTLLGIKVVLRTSARKTELGPHIDAPLWGNLPDTGLPTLYIGTHALLSDTFKMKRVGLVIIDEQHKFGVAQREKLVKKAYYPHVLVMTATPIPRTLALTIYGDLDVSIIDELPPGRGRVRTFLRTPDALPRVWEFVAKQLQVGRQAYVVYPRIEETSENVKAVLKEYKRLKEIFAPYPVGLIHGQLNPEEKESVMQAFRDNKICVLVTTAVIEVGLDVPNATIMVIENAEKFGLAQLHQLRGRVGRGAHESYCILICGNPTSEAMERLQILEKTTNGFEIAEADMRIRGPGDMLGYEQSGIPKFEFGNLITDLPLLRLAKLLAIESIRVTQTPDFEANAESTNSRHSKKRLGLQPPKNLHD